MEVINNIHKKLYEAISLKYSVVDVVEENIKLPFVRMAEYECDTETDKLSKNKSYNITQELHIWSDYQGKKEVNEITEDIIEIVENLDLGYNTICNYCLNKSINDLDGYKQGVLLFDIKVEK